ncbi:MAG: helix-turn-helix domain-containing protein [Pseudonocardiales bacterium]|nr:helix-turn-helix domain-containing protein [Pseudonocardiales bacterium]
MSLRVVVELAGISAGHLSRIENGQRALDRRSLIVALADALQVSPTELASLPIPALDNAPPMPPLTRYAELCSLPPRGYLVGRRSTPMSCVAGSLTCWMIDRHVATTPTPRRFPG